MGVAQWVQRDGGGTVGPEGWGWHSGSRGMGVAQWVQRDGGGTVDPYVEIGGSLLMHGMYELSHLQISRNEISEKTPISTKA